MQKQQKVTEKEQWREVVGDLWDKRLQHLRKGVYSDIYDPRTQQYGFQVGSEYDRKNSLMDDLMKEPSVPSNRKEEEHVGQPGDKGIMHVTIYVLYYYHCVDKLRDGLVVFDSITQSN